MVQWIIGITLRFITQNCSSGIESSYHVRLESVDLLLKC